MATSFSFAQMVRMIPTPSRRTRIATACPVFLTGPEFLPELREHRGRTLTLIDKSEANGHTRVAEMNKDVLANLDRIIAQIDEEPESTDHAIG